MKKIALVTGGATGLGYCIAEEFLKSGIDVCIVGRREHKLIEAKNTLEKTYGIKVQYAAGDIADETFVKDLYAKLAGSNEYVQYLVNCAGTGQFGPAENNTRQMIDIALEASLIGLILMSSKAVTSMKENGGFVVNVMSTASLKGKANETVYCAAKWGARGFTEALKEVTKGTKVKVIGVYPGGMKTDFWSPECGVNMDASQFMEPQEVAETIVHAVLERKSMYVSDLTIDRK